MPGIRPALASLWLERTETGPGGSEGATDHRQPLPDHARSSPSPGCPSNTDPLGLAWGAGIGSGEAHGRPGTYRTARVLAAGLLWLPAGVGATAAVRFAPEPGMWAMVPPAIRAPADVGPTIRMATGRRHVQAHVPGRRRAGSGSPYVSPPPPSNGPCLPGHYGELIVMERRRAPAPSTLAFGAGTLSINVWFSSVHSSREENRNDTQDKTPWVE